MDRKVWRNFDLVLLGATIALIVLGVAVIHSATIDTPALEELTYRQAIYAVVGLLLMLGVAAIDYRFLGNLQKPIYGLMIGSLIIVFVIGEISHGAQRWIDFRLFPIQPSELAKVLVIITLAKYLSDHGNEIWRFRYIVFSFFLVIPPMVLIYLQPDLGMTIVLAVVWLGLTLAAGMRLLHFSILGAASVLATPLIWPLLKDYMRQRIATFIFPAQDPLGTGYNLNQARIAIGSGGWLGQGFASGSQSQLHFLRVRHTDFVFSVLAEELGFIGALLLFSLLILVLWRILRAASLARDAFGFLIAWGVAVILFFQSFVSIAMNLGLMPTTGIPLPFVCYGGSSLITVLVGLGLVQSVVMRHRKIDFQ